MASKFLEDTLAQLRSPQFLACAALFVVFELVITLGIDANSAREELQWHWLSLYFLILCGLTPVTLDAKLFFRGGIADDASDAAPSQSSTASSFAFIAASTPSPSVGVAASSPRPGGPKLDAPTAFPSWRSAARTMSFSSIFRRS